MSWRKQLWGIWLAVAVVAIWLAWPRGAVAPARETQLGVDAGLDARTLAGIVSRDPANAPRGWARLRGVPDHRGSFSARNETRLALRETQRQGVRSFVLLTAAGYPWPNGVRDLAGIQGTLPLDLRDAYQRGKWLGERYGADVEAWEIDNEPELIYVRDNPENYAAYLKAMYLGLKRGALERATSYKGQGASDKEPAGDSWNLGLGTWHLRRAPRVVMAPMAFPPGPFFEALLDNDLLSYTDGFNFHYYGYEEDLPGVYRQFETAVSERSTKLEEGLQMDRRDASYTSRDDNAGEQGKRDSAEVMGALPRFRPLPPVQLGLIAIGDRQVAVGDSGDHLLRKRLPVFVSEYGYGLLSGTAAATVDGRVQQWEYFRALAEHMRALQIEGSMAFLLRPYLEDEAREFGLLVKPENGGKEPGDARDTHAGPPRGPSAETKTFTAGGVTFTPADFGAAGVEPWMRDIGRRFGEWEASPALAWLLHQPPLPESRAWDVVVRAPSPVVIDFIAGEGMRPSKNSRGHFLTGSAERSVGRGAIYVYNFARRAVRGRLRIDGHADVPRAERIELLPGGRHELQLDFSIERLAVQSRPWTVRFEPDEAAIPPSRFRSSVYPDMAGFSHRLVADLRHDGVASARNAHRLDSRSLARGEAPLHVQGRWRVTKGVRVEESAGIWRFAVTGFPDEIMRPAVAELPLPDDFRFPRFGFFLADLRLMPRPTEAVRLVPEPRSEPEFSAVDKETMGIFFRTAQGGLYATTMHFPATTEWLRFTQIADNFFTVFYGRMHFPWRFMENEPVALVLMFRPRLLPATYEVRNARIVELVRAERKKL